MLKNLKKIREYCRSMRAQNMKLVEWHKWIVPQTDISRLLGGKGFQTLELRFENDRYTNFNSFVIREWD